MPSTRLCALAVALSVGASASPVLARQQPAPQNPLAAAAAPEPLPRRLLKAEDARVLSAATQSLLVEGMKSDDAAIRAQAVRAAGRFETPTLLNDITPLLTDQNADVRHWAAIATANAAKLFTQPAIDELLRVMSTASPAAWADAAAALGRIAMPTPAELRRVEQVLAAKLPAPTSRAMGGGRAAAEGDAIVVEGAARGLEALTRLSAKVAPLGDDARSRLYLVVESADGPGAPARARARRLALQALRNARAVDADLVRTALRDRDDEVRRLAVVAAGAAAPAEGGGVTWSADDRAAVLTAGLTDAEPRVRYEAVRGWSRHLQARDCQPLLRAVADASPHVALAALDALAEPCEAPGVTALLQKEAAAAPAQGGTWHRAAHALLALARVAPAEARPLEVRAAANPVWQARMYAARAAGRSADVDILVRLGADAHDGVREAALSELVRLKRAEAIPIAHEGLTHPDYHLVMTSARALAADRDRVKATQALITAMLRLTFSGRDTSRDPRVAIMEALAATATADDGDAIAAYLSDWDPKVAQAAATTYAALTKQTREATPSQRPSMPPDTAALDAAAGKHLRITMARGGVIELRLLADVAPATVARVTGLASKGYYNGLTFHRVEPTFVLQGGSPGANEYMGDGAFMRDEPGVSHTRGTVGISTRGRDTGDAQIFVNLVDSPRLDHDYTVFAVVERGMEVADTVLEGDVMAKVELVDAPRR